MALIIVFWGLGPPVSKLISAPSVIAVLYRFWLSVPVFYLMALGAGHRLTMATIKRTVFAGAAFGINLVFVFLTINEAAVAVLSVIAALQPGMILLVAGRFLGERPTPWHLLWTVVGVGGTVVVVLGGGRGFEVSTPAIVYSVVSQLFFTFYFVETKRVRSRNPIDSIEWMAGVTLFAALTVTPWALITSDRADYLAVNGLDWVWLAFIIIFTGGLGHVLMAWVLKYIDASRSSLYLLSMNIVAIGVAWLIHDEPLSVVQLAGGAIVFAAVGAVVSRPAEPAMPATAPPT
ncbi:MAG: DMT family transporter [Actinomycetota bacterium]|nr:DMT family transporter [Actinomycetota bacterium]